MRPVRNSQAGHRWVRSGSCGFTHKCASVASFVAGAATQTVGFGLVATVIAVSVLALLAEVVRAPWIATFLAYRQLRWNRDHAITDRQLRELDQTAIALANVARLDGNAHVEVDGMATPDE